jgi:spermidine synthase
MSKDSSKKLLILPLFFLSGMSGLIYEVLWVRAFANYFGSSVLSASLVTAIFMGGLGLGSYLAGGFIDRRSSKDRMAPLRFYAYAEAIVGVLGVLVCLVLQYSESVSVAFSSYVLDENGWYVLSFASHLLRYVFASVMLAPVCILLGGTLTFLVRFMLEGDLVHSGWKVGLLYGINTVGAALGCLLVDAVLIPVLGLVAASSVAAVANWIAAYGALRLAASISRTETSLTKDVELSRNEPPKVESSVTQTDGFVRRTMYLVVAASFFAGALGMGLEIVWFRFLSSVLGSFRSVFSLLLATVLVGIWIGSLLGGYLDRKWQRPALLWGLSTAGIIVFNVICIYFFDSSWKDATHSGAAYAGDAGYFATAMPIAAKRLAAVVVAIGPSSVLLGFAFPLANSLVQNSQASVGKRVGIVYFANTGGNILGSLLTGFALIPLMGMQGSVTVLSILGIASIVCLLAGRLGSSSRKSRIGLLAGCLVAAGAVVFWSSLGTNFIALKALSKQEKSFKLLAVDEGLNETIAIVEFDDLHRGLFTNGYLMTGTHFPAQRYMRAFSHLPLLHMENPEHVLVICFGVGNTLHAASLHQSVKSLEVVDLSRNVLRHAHYFEKWNANVLEDSRVRVFVNDGRQHLRMQSDEAQSYDLITLEPPPLRFAGVSSLYSKEFYQLARARLKEGGYLSQWLPAYQVDEEVTLSIIRTFADVFPGSVLLTGYDRHLILLGSKGGDVRIDPGLVSKKLKENKALRADLEGILMGSEMEIMGAFAGAYETLDSATRDRAQVTDDLPLLEFHSTNFLGRVIVPREIFDTSQVDKWCPDCFENGRPVESLTHLDTYLEMLNVYYASYPYRYSHTALLPEQKELLFLSPRPQLISTLSASAYLRTLFPGLLKKLIAEEEMAKQSDVFVPF